MVCFHLRKKIILTLIRYLSPKTREFKKPKASTQIVPYTLQLMIYCFQNFECNVLFEGRYTKWPLRPQVPIEKSERLKWPDENENLWLLTVICIGDNKENNGIQSCRAAERRKTSVELISWQAGIFYLTSISTSRWHCKGAKNIFKFRYLSFCLIIWARRKNDFSVRKGAFYVHRYSNVLRPFYYLSASLVDSILIHLEWIIQIFRGSLPCLFFSNMRLGGPWLKLYLTKSVRVRVPLKKMLKKTCTDLPM